MPGDPTSGNDDDLLGQIDELKARMDRLMRGGSSTSNSALLTDTVPKRSEPRATAQNPSPDSPSLDRTRARDLIDSEDEEIVEVYPAPDGVVHFPDEIAEPAVAPPPSKPISESRPSPRPHRSAPIGGSVIPVEEDVRAPRPIVASFDELGSAIQEELARDASVPPADEKKGPDLASRFGPADKPTAEALPPLPPTVEDAEDEAPEDEAPEDEAPEDEAPEEETDRSPDEIVSQDAEYQNEPRTRSNVGLVAAIWVLVAIASGAIATLHFTGSI